MWEGQNGLRRFYYNNWDRYCENSQLEDYKQRYLIDPLDRDVGIKVFFDDEGYLHINNCHDPELKTFLERKIIGWYKWTAEKFSEAHSFNIKVIDVVRPYLTEFKPGMFRVDYDGKTFIFDSNYKAHLDWTVFATYNYGTEKYSVDTGFPKLDEIVLDMLKNNGDPSEYDRSTELGKFFDRYQ